MTNSIRLWAVAGFLAGAAVITSSTLRSDADGKNGLPDDGRGPAAKQAADDAEAALIKSKFDQGGVLTYQPLQGEQLFAWQLKPDLGQPVPRPRDLLIMVSTSAGMAGKHFIAAQQLTEAVIKNAGPKDRVSVWMVNVPKKEFTACLTRGFIDPVKDQAKVQEALKALGQQFPAGDADLNSALTSAIDSFEANEDRQLAVLYIGDGQSNYAPLSSADRNGLGRKMVDRKIAFFPVPMGRQMSPENLHGLATATGGIVVRVQLLQDKAEEAVARVHQTLAAPILYPSKVQMPAEVVEFFPTRLPPLRGDAPTLVVGKIKATKQLTATIDGVIAGKPGRFSGKVSDAVPEPDLDNFFLISLIRQWQGAKEQPALIRADRALAFAYEENRIAREDLLGSAHLAMKQRNLEAAAQLYEKALQLAPQNREAIECLKLVEGLKSGKINWQKILDQFDDAKRKAVKLDSKNGAIRWTVDQVSKLVQTDDKGPAQVETVQDKENALKNQRDKTILEEQQLGRSIDADLRQAREQMKTDPDGAHERVRAALLRVKDYPDLSDAVRDQLLKRLQTQLREISTQAQQIKLRLAQQAEARDVAMREADLRLSQKTEEERFESRFRVYKGLMNEARYDILHRQATTDQILVGLKQIEEEARVKGMQVPLAVQAAYKQTLAAYNLQVQMDLRPERERNFLAIMLEIEKAHIPLPDEPPIHFMTRLPASQQVKAWEMLSRRRKDRYEGADFLDDQDARKAVEKIAKMTDLVIETKDFQQELSLKEFLIILYEKLSGDKQDLPIIIDVDAFKEENPDAPDIYDTKVKFPPVPRKMKVGTALRLALSKVATNNATYVIRPDFIEITTIERQTKEKALRVYPVGDLVIPIATSMNPYASGGFGGLGGGFGAVGGGFGALGGGLGALGGGLGALGGGFGALGGGLGAFGGGLGGGLGALGGGLGALGGGLGAFGGGLGALGGGLGAFGGGLGAMGGGLGAFGGGLGAMGGGLGLYGGGGLGAMGGGLGLYGGGMGAAGIPGQNCLGFNQFNGGLGAFGTGGLDQGLILLIRQVVAPGEWDRLNCQLQYSSFPMFGGSGIGAAGTGGPGGPGLPGFPGAPGTPSLDPADQAKVNHIAFYPAALALVVQGTSRKHYKYNGGILGGVKRGEKAVLFDDMKNKDGVIVIGPGSRDADKGKVDVLGNKERADVAKLDPKVIWQEALSKGMADPGLVVATADFLFEEGYFDHAVEFLKANLRQGIVVQPWVYEALAIAMEQNGDALEDVQRVRLSGLSLDPTNPQSFLKAAKAASDAGNHERALAFCRKAAQLDPSLPSPYADALVYAERGKDTKGMEWAVGRLAAQDWATDATTLQAKVSRNLNNLLNSLQKENRGDEAAKLKAALATSRIRDLVVNLTWEAGASGAADLEMEIREPSGTVCSSQVRQSPGGGVLTGLDLTALGQLKPGMPKASYTAAEAFSGEYEVKVRRLWGQPASGKFRLEIIQHQGTPQEKHRIEVVTIDQQSAVKFVLAGGRRKDVAQITPATLQQQARDEQVKNENVLTKLRALADPVHGSLPRGISSGVSKAKGLPGVIPALAKQGNKSSEQVVFQDGISSVGGGMTVTTQARMSADGQYMRLSVQPVFQPGTIGTSAPRIEMPLIPGGSEPQ
jgi:tetratricopeptide (TPR) repeat protein